MRVHTGRVLALGLAGLLLTACTSHEPSLESSSGGTVAVATEFAFDRERISARTPWTSAGFLDGPGELRFAVVGDRTGGAREGVYERAVEELQLLRPAFVINVGDLVEGYTRDPEVLGAMWDQVDVLHAPLPMRFFYVPGNHDIGSAEALAVWRERFGVEYYAFVYRNVLFIALDSEDPPRPVDPEFEAMVARYNELRRSDPDAAQELLEEFMESDQYGEEAIAPRFSDEQVAFVRRTLETHSDVRWTFLFLHQPAWKGPTDNFLAIEAALEGRPYTFIAGHMHYYDYTQRNGREYITMGSTGGVWHTDGPGNVDHVMMVTMTDAGPEIANISLAGVFDRRGPGAALGADEAEGGQ